MPKYWRVREIKVTLGALYIGSSLFWGGCRAKASTAIQTCGIDLTELHGVWWPGKMEAADRRALRDFLVSLQKRVSSSRTNDPTALTKLARLAAVVGQLDLAVEASSRALVAAPQDTTAVSLAVASLLARSQRTGSVPDLLDSAEIAVSHEGDPALRCNRLQIFLALGLIQHVEDLRATCPCKLSLTDQMLMDGNHHGSADLLSPREFVAIISMVESGHLTQARAHIHSEAQAWRVFLEQGALAQWLTALKKPGEREAVERRLTILAHLYYEESGNSQPLRLIEHLSSLRQPEARRIAPALRQWIEGMRLVSVYRAEEAERLLLTARPVLRAAGSPLSASLELALAALRYHLGDAHGMGERALAARRQFDCEHLPWECARALWLEAVALQAEADWEPSLSRADESIRLFLRLGETANAAYVETVRGVAFESMASMDEAASAYLAATRGLAQKHDTKLLAGALSLFARQQRRAGRSKIAVELQRESLLLDRLGGTPNLIAESTALLAEQLIGARHYDEAWATVRQAHALVESIPGQTSRRRALAILSQIEAELALRESPQEAVVLLTRFLNQFESFGDHSFRAEALLARSRAYSQIGAAERARQDLIDALAEVANQSAKLSDRVRSVALLDRAREALEELVAVLLKIDPTGTTALDWIERLRLEQAARGFGLPSRVARTLPPPGIAGNVCVTEYFSLPDELLSWTSCGGRRVQVRRTLVQRLRLVSILTAFQMACRKGSRPEIAAASAEASAWLVAPQEKFIRGSVSWIVVPDPLFPAIPFAWLSIGEHFLFEDREVLVGPSIGELRPQRVTRRAWRALALGDPALEAGGAVLLPSLPYAAKEANYIATLFPGSAARIGHSATWSAVLSAAPQSFNLLHIASHITGGSLVPLAARLHLAPEPARPSGRVSADEVASRRIRGLDLVVLASCSSAAERPTRLAGSLDFSQAFRHAGAGAVVGTLWNVSDREIALALTRFYDHLRVGKSSGEALRQLWQDSLEERLTPAELASLTSLQITSAQVHGDSKEETYDQSVHLCHGFGTLSIFRRR
jgi:CHAT domain-containing protein